MSEPTLPAAAGVESAERAESTEKAEGAERVESAALAAARRARAAQEALAAAGERQRPIPPPPIRDPLPLCVYTTVALLAWIVSPGLVAALFALAGFRAYAQAWRAGLRRSDCVLVDPRLVMLYLAGVALAGFAWTAWRVATALHLVAGVAH